GAYATTRTETLPAPAPARAASEGTGMDFDASDKAAALGRRLRRFMDEHVHPAERTYVRQVNTGDRWQPVPLVEDLKGAAREAGLWNLFLSADLRAALDRRPTPVVPADDLGAGLTNREYAPLCEVMGRVWWAPEVFNCSAPDT